MRVKLDPERFRGQRIRVLISMFMALTAFSLGCFFLFLLKV
jgi:hypothetical protein